MRKPEIREFIEEMGLPNGDTYDLPSSEKRFVDGSHYKLELLPYTVEEYQEAFSVADDVDLTINRITDCTGSMYDSDEEIKKKVQICHERDAELLMIPGPGGSPSQQKALGALPDPRLRGIDNLVDVTRELIRTVDLGCRGFLILDEGLLNVALELREDGVIPADTIFKMSASFGISNPASVSLWTERVGLTEQDSINPVRDLTYPMLGAFRQASDISLDVHAFWHGDVNRTLETPEIARIAAPVYFKNSGEGSIAEKVRQSKRIVDQIQAEEPDLVQSDGGHEGIPEPSQDVLTQV